LRGKLTDFPARCITGKGVQRFFADASGCGRSRALITSLVSCASGAAVDRHGDVPAPARARLDARRGERDRGAGDLRPGVRPLDLGRTPCAAASRRTAGGAADHAREPAAAGARHARLWSSSGRAGAVPARARRRRSSASPRARPGAGRVVGVDWSDALSGARAFIRRYAWTFPDVRDSDGPVGYAYRITNLPTTFVVDAHGRIRSGPARAAERSLMGAGRWARSNAPEAQAKG